MKVGIDTFGCDHGRSGLGSYLNSLVQYLKNEDDVQYELFGAEIDRYTYGNENDIGYKSISLPDSLTAERTWHLLAANRFAKKQKYDVVLYPAAAHMLPFFFGVPGVAIVNDVVSEIFASKKDTKHEIHIKHSLNKAEKIIAASYYIKRDLERLGIKSDKITVIHNGLDHSMFYPRELLSPNLVDIKPFAIQRPYFIYASRLSSPSKKHVELIKAFTLFKERTHLPHRLVLAGSEGPYSEDVHKAVYASRSASDIFVTGFFPHESFPELYSGSDGCIFPSVSEGVGLPVLESMATGVPVACSQCGALPEIAGENALYFNSDDIEQMAAALTALATDKSLKEKLVTGGLEWAKRFSWEKTAQLIQEVLQGIAKK
ncbi:MAG: glycosyltransferase family 4 protein [Treponema sp.]|nr:glycosyltransferase family 4 protein [Treponema sp.]